MVSIGTLINELIMINIRTWHEDTKVRNRNTIKEVMTDTQIAELSLAGRRLNRQRSDVRYAINQYFGELMEDRKINYLETKQ